MQTKQPKCRRKRRMAGQIKRFMCFLLAVLMISGTLPTASLAAKNEPSQKQAVTFGVMSDAHYFPVKYNGNRAEDYQKQISGDLRLMGEGEALTAGAVDQMLEQGNLPSVLLVTGDLSSEGELASHQGFAAQMKRLQDAGVLVLVIPGNHDLYNTSAMTFENDTQVKDNGTGSLWTTEAQFREIYASMGYDRDATMAQADFITDILYFKETGGEIADCQGGLSYLVKTNQGFAFLMIDTEIYTADVNGAGKAQGTGKGMMSEELLEWAEEQIRDCAEENLTVIAGMHHPLLSHNTTQETEFVTDTVRLDMNTKDVNQTIVKRLANAGLRWVFTGHMHENDIASYTTAAGNTIYDMETGGLVAYPAPYRMVTADREYRASTMKMEENLSIRAIRVKEAAMNAKWNGTEIYDAEKTDVAAYMTEAMYGPEFPSKLIFRYADRYLDQLSDVPAALQNIGGIDLYRELYQALPGILAGGQNIDLGGSIGTIEISYSSTSYTDACPGVSDKDGDGIHLNPASGFAGLLGSFTVRDGDLQTEIQSVLDQFEEQWAASGKLKESLDSIIKDAVSTVIVAEDARRSYTLQDLVQSMFLRHNSGQDTEPLEAWQEEGLRVLADGGLLNERVMEIIQGNPDDTEAVSLYGLIHEVTDSLTINLNTLFGRNTLWSTAINAVMGGSNVSVSELLNKFGVDIEEILNGLINEYLSDSFFSSVGGVVDNMISGFAVDSDGLDDVADGKAKVLSYTGERSASGSDTLPSQITVSADTEAPENTRTFSWYTGTDVAQGEIQLIPADNLLNAEEAKEALDAAPEGGVIEAAAETEEVSKAKVTLNLILITQYDIVQANRHTVSVELEEGQDYWYRVGTDNYKDDYGKLWSDPVLLQGDGNGAEDSFTWINVADSQGANEGDYSHYTQVLADAETVFDDAAFITHLGDMVDDGINENYWTWVLDTEEMQTLPVMPAAGNHEARSKEEALANAMEAHYNIPGAHASSDGSGIYYSFTYKNALFLVFNTNETGGISQEQLSWAESTAEASDAQWKIVLTHKAPYSKGPHSDESDVASVREILNEFCEKYDIDLVLSGHDHTYLRTPFLTAGQEAAEAGTQQVVHEGNRYEQYLNPDGTCFIIPSTSGVKYYKTSSVDYGWTPEKETEGGAMTASVYSGLTIEGDELYYTAYTYDPETGSRQLYDSFSISKSETETAVDAVIAMIDALPLPEDITLDDRAAVEAARAAYEALTDAEKELVTNLDRLEAAEAELQKLLNSFPSGTAVVKTGEELRTALNDDSIGTITLAPEGTDLITVGTYKKGFLGSQTNTKENDWIISVDHNVRIEGEGYTIERCGLIIENGASVVLNNVNLQSNEKDSTGNKITPMNLITIKDGTLYTEGSTSVYQFLQDGSFKDIGKDTENGHAIYFTDQGGAVYLNGTGEVYGANEAVYASGTAEGSVSVSAGSVSCGLDDAQSVVTTGDIRISGGQIQSVRLANPEKDMIMTGGAIYNAQAQASAVYNEGATYISGGTVRSDQNVCFYTDWTGDDGWDQKPAVYIGGTAQIIGQNGVTVSALELSSDDNLHLNVPEKDFYVAEAHRDDSGIYVSENGFGSLKELAENTEGKLETELKLDETVISDRGMKFRGMSAELTETGIQYAYAKIRVVYGGSLTDKVESGNIVGRGAWCNLWIVSPELRVNNQPVTSVELEVKPAPVLETGKSLALKSKTEPSTALNNTLTWTSSNDTVAAVDAEGCVTAKAAGTAVITAEAPSGAKAEMTIVCAEPSVSGADSLGMDEEQQSYTLETGLATMPEGLTVRWTVSGGNASIDENGVLTRTSAGGADLTVTGELVYNGVRTGVKAEKQVKLEAAAGEISLSAAVLDEAGNTAYASGQKTNKNVEITVEYDSRKTVEYSTDGGKTWTELEAEAAGDVTEQPEEGEAGGAEETPAAPEEETPAMPEEEAGSAEETPAVPEEEAGSMGETPAAPEEEAGSTGETPAAPEEEAGDMESVLEKNPGISEEESGAAEEVQQAGGTKPAETAETVIPEMQQLKAAPAAGEMENADTGEDYRTTARLYAEAEENGRLNQTYLFRYQGSDSDTAVQPVSFTVDISKAAPGLSEESFAAGTSDGTLAENGFTVPEGMTAAVGGKEYGAGAEIPLRGGSWQVALKDEYGNTAELTVRVPVFLISWEAPEGEGMVRIINLTESMAALKENGTSESVTRGDQVQITAVPADGYALKSLKANDREIEQDTILTVNEELQIAAEFEKQEEPSENPGDGTGGSGEEEHPDNGGTGAGEENRPDNGSTGAGDAEKPDGSGTGADSGNTSGGGTGSGAVQSGKADSTDKNSSAQTQSVEGAQTGDNTDLIHPVLIFCLSVSCMGILIYQISRRRKHSR